MTEYGAPATPSPPHAVPARTDPSQANGTVPAVPEDPGRWRCGHARLLGSRGAGPPSPARGHAHSGRAQPASAFWLGGSPAKVLSLLLSPLQRHQHLTVPGCKSSALALFSRPLGSPSVPTCTRQEHLCSSGLRKVLCGNARRKHKPTRQ